MNSPPLPLLPHETEQVDEFAKNADFHLPLMQYLAKRWHASDDDMPRMIAKWGTQYFDWTPEQIQQGWSVYWLSQNVGNWIYRRIIRNDPAELAVGRCLELRLQWFNRRLSEQSGIGVDEDDSGFIPAALGVRDVALAERIAAGHPVKRSDEVSELIRLSTLAAFRRDTKSIRPWAERLMKRKAHRAAKSMGKCFLGLAEQNAEYVTAALQEMVDDANRGRKKREAEIVCTDAHDFYRLSQWVLPELVAGFDVHQPLPWDAEFHAWTEENQDPLTGMDLMSLSPFFHEMIVRLQIPDWWRVIQETELARDLCELELLSFGPNVKAVTEIIDTLVRVRKFPPPDLAQGCPIAFRPLERVASYLLKRQFVEAGASAVIKKISSAEKGE